LNSYEEEQKIISNSLSICIILSLAIMLLGLFSHFIFNLDSIMFIGIWLLILTPLVRLSVFIIKFFKRRREVLMALITFLILFFNLAINFFL